MTDYCHGLPHIGLRVAATDLDSYAEHARRFIETTQSGKITVRIDLTKGFFVSHAGGGAAGPEHMPKPEDTRYAHRVEATQEWQQGAGDKRRTVKDEHVYFFDLTPVLTASQKAEIEEKAGLERPNKGTEG